MTEPAFCSIYMSIRGAAIDSRRLDVLLTEEQITKNDLAACDHLTAETLWRWMSGSEISFEQLKRAAEALKYLSTGDGILPAWWKNLVGRAAIDIPLKKLVGKQRPRITRTGIVYTPKATRNAEARIRGAWLDKIGTQWANFDGEVHVKISAHRALPKSKPRRLLGSPNLTSPDIDNVSKLVLDALNGTAYADDRQVTQLKAVKKDFSDSCKISIAIEYFERGRINEK